MNHVVCSYFGEVSLHILPPLYPSLHSTLFFLTADISPCPSSTYACLAIAHLSSQHIMPFLVFQEIQLTPPFRNIRDVGDIGDIERIWRINRARGYTEYKRYWRFEVIFSVG